MVIETDQEVPEDALKEIIVMRQVLDIKFIKPF
jgi:hypothetical protein